MLKAKYLVKFTAPPPTADLYLASQCGTHYTKEAMMESKHNIGNANHSDKSSCGYLLCVM